MFLEKFFNGSNFEDLWNNLAAKYILLSLFNHFELPTWVSQSLQNNERQLSRLVGVERGMVGVCIEEWKNEERIKIFSTNIDEKQGNIKK